jgi:hypothetical protein
MRPPFHEAALPSCQRERSQSPAQQTTRGVEGTRRFLCALWDQAKHGGRLMFAILDEIFDESAYGRFLARQQLPPSRQTYAAFRNEYELTQVRRPRCC